MEDKCRICLATRKKLRSLFEVVNSTEYAAMISAIANVKVAKGDGLPDKICRSCSKKLEDSYEFRTLIESSNASLTDCGKRINFTDINEIKIEIDLNTRLKIEKHDDEKSKDICLDFDGNDDVVYSNTTIKKVKNNWEEEKPKTVLDFLNDLKEEIFQSDADDNETDYVDYGPDSHESDDEYLPPNQPKRYKKSAKSYKKKTQSNMKEKASSSSSLNKLKNTIKPVFLNNLKIVSTQKKDENAPKAMKKKYKRKAREMVCPHCGILSKHLKAHLISHTEKTFKCEHCPKAFYNQTNLATHQAVHTGVRDFKCDKCPAEFYKRETLRSHMLSHETEKRFTCDLCNKSYKRKSKLHLHIKKHNPSNKTVPCEFCSRSFFDKINLNHHMRVHTGDRPYKCEKRVLQLHMRRHNSANKNVKCELCNMSFFTVTSLDHHMRIHTGLRPYNCEICNQPYSYKHDFNRHCYNKHGVFLKRRSVKIMNEEVLARERAVMQELKLRAMGLKTDDKPLEVFTGPQGLQAMQMALKAVTTTQYSRYGFPIKVQI